MKSTWLYLTDISIKSPDESRLYGSRESDALPLVVNCAGRIISPKKQTNNVPKGRLDYYMLYVIAGKIEIFTENEPIIVGANSLVVFPPKKGYSHTLIVDEEPVNYLWVHFTGSATEKSLSECGIKLFPEVNQTSTMNSISSRFQKLFEGFARKDRFRDLDLCALLYRLLIEVGRAIENKSADKISLSKSIRYINEFYNTQIKISHLAKIENVCMTTYNLHFKRQLGITPTQYITKLRIDSAVELLESSDHTVQEISELCGFVDANFFTRTFKKAKGVSPTAYRKTCQKR